MSRLSRAAAGGELRVDDGCVGAALAGPRRWLGSAVEWKKLGEVAKICRGVRVVKKELTDDGKYAVYQNSLKPLGYYGEANVNGGTAFVIGAGAAGEVGYSEQDFWAADDCYYIDGGERLIGRYVYYCLTSRQDWLLGKVRKASIPRLSRDFIAALEIPLPPLPVQREIVQILDNFANLTAELTAELAKRKKQYEHYRDMLLNFEGGGRYDKFGVESGEFRVEWKRLGEICDMVTDYTAAGSFADIARNVEYKREVDFAQLVRTTDIKSRFTKEAQIFISESAYKYLWRVHLDQASIVLPNIGNCGEVYFITPDILPYKKSALAPNALLIRSSNIDLKFLYYWFTGDDFQKRLKKIVSPVGQGKFNKTELKQLLIPLPPLAEQERIVAILDRFDALCNSLTEGLPAEIALRKKQYEYYRDKLLSFKEVG